jgi:outer membrane receptor protein involved in Fe transport
MNASQLLRLVACIFPVASWLPAQQAPAALSPAQEARALARYDANRNGRLDPEELAALRADEARAGVAASRTTAWSERDEVIALTPFEVSAANDRGYFATSTMSGTRVNSKIEDLAASISVVTKQQLLDTAAVDLNDIFLYEANTEGIGQFTDFIIDRGNVVDNVAGSPQTANRIRGLGAANITINGFSGTSNLPSDTYNLESAEISRGPNSSIAGLGDAAGTVNLNTARANPTRASSRVQGRIDSYGGWRASVDLNRPLLKDRLALRVLGVHEERGYVRKPSLDRTDRWMGAVTYRPFKDTVIRVSYEHFGNFNQRPNATPPRDGVSEWLAAGKPTWDPVTYTALVNGLRTAPIPSGSGTTAENNFGVLPRGLYSDGSAMARILAYVDNSAYALLQQGRNPASAFTYNGIAVPNPNPAGLVATSNNQRIMFSGTYTQRGFNAAGVSTPLFNMPVVTNRGLYDWTETNFVAPNYGLMWSNNTGADLEHTFVSTGRHYLGVSAGWYRQDTVSYSRNFIGQSDGAPSILRVNVNERLLDGSPNPYFLRPFVGGNEPQLYMKPQFNDNYRANAVYKLDLSREKGALKWLGSHQAVAYGEYRLLVQAPTSLRYRDQVVDNPDFVSLTAVPGSNGGHLYPQYYMGDAVGSNVDYAPGRPAQATGSFNVSYFNPTTGRWNPQNPVSLQQIYFSQGMQKRKIRTEGFSYQGSLLDNRIVPTLGFRRDRSYNQDNRPLPNFANGLPDPAQLTWFGQNKKWTAGDTHTKGVVVRPFQGIALLDRAAEGADLGGYLARVLRGLQFSYNQSDSFVPADVAYNLFGEVLPNPTGRGKDYGVTLRLADRLNVRVNRYETLQQNARGSLGVIATRANRLDFPQNGSTDSFNLLSVATGWVTALRPTLTSDQVQAEVAKIIGLDNAFITNVQGRSINDVNNARSRGTEVEVNYNPSQHWTVKLAGAQQSAIDTGLSPNIQRYIEQRMPFWTTIKVPTDRLPDGSQLANAGANWWTLSQGSGGRPDNFYIGNVLAPLKLGITTQGKRKPQTREYSANFSTSYQLAGLVDANHWLKTVRVGGSLRWASRGAIGFMAGAPEADGIIRSLDGNRPIYDRATTNADVFASYGFRLWNNKVRGSVQLNVRNVTEGGRLQPIAANPDGSVWNYRIIDPRQFILSTSFDL